MIFPSQSSVGVSRHSITWYADCFCALEHQPRSFMASDTTTTNYEFDDRGEAMRQINSLLRGDISAAETYRMAIAKVVDGYTAGHAQMLEQMQQEHGRAAQELRERIRSLGGEPSESSGAWGAWAQTVQGTMNLFGDAAALKSLKEGEEHGLKDYQEALDDTDPLTAGLIHSELIPKQQKHIEMLDQLINAAGQA